MASYDELASFAENRPTYNHDTEPEVIRILQRELGAKLAGIGDVARREYYQAVISSAYWWALSIWLRLERGSCEACGSSEDLQTHHRTYRFLGCEIDHLDSLAVLCRGCHETHHVEEAESHRALPRLQASQSKRRAERKSVRRLPTNRREFLIEVERGTVGGLFMFPDMTPATSLLLPSANYFVDARIATIFQASVLTSSVLPSFDAVNVAERLDRDGLLDVVGGVELILELLEASARTRDQLIRFARQVRAAAEFRLGLHRSS